MSTEIVYVTPSYIKDIGRFALLRESLRLFSPDILHVAYVDSEDFGAFEQRFKGERNLEIIPTSDILPAGIERERRFWRSRLGDLATRVGWRFRLQRPYSGWKLQQLIKMEALSRMSTKAAVFLDSDLILCRRMEARDYFVGDDLVLLETPAETYEDFAFEVTRQGLFKESILKPMAGFNYIHQAPRFLSRTGRRLVEMMRERHRNWHGEFLSRFMPSEYNLLGYVAREVERYQGYAPDRSGPEAWVYAVKSQEEIAPQLAACRAEHGRRGFILIQSNMHLSEEEYAETVREILRNVSTMPEARPALGA